MRRIAKILLTAGLILVDVAGWLPASDEANIQGAKKERALVAYTSLTVDQAQKLNDADAFRLENVQKRV